MRSFLFAATILVPVAAMAEEPATLVLPTPVVAAVGKYLSERPYGEVAGMVQALQQCVAAQMPGQHGECPAVTAAIQAKTPPAVAAPSKD